MVYEQLILAGAYKNATATRIRSNFSLLSFQCYCTYTELTIDAISIWTMNEHDKPHVLHDLNPD